MKSGSGACRDPLPHSRCPRRTRAAPPLTTALAGGSAVRLPQLPAMDAVVGSEVEGPVQHRRGPGFTRPPARGLALQARGARARCRLTDGCRPGASRREGGARAGQGDGRRCRGRGRSSRPGRSDSTAQRLGPSEPGSACAPAGSPRATTDDTSPPDPGPSGPRSSSGPPGEGALPRACAPGGGVSLPQPRHRGGSSPASSPHARQGRSSQPGPRLARRPGGSARSPQSPLLTGTGRRPPSQTRRAPPRAHHVAPSWPSWGSDTAIGPRACWKATFLDRPLVAGPGAAGSWIGRAEPMSRRTRSARKSAARAQAAWAKALRRRGGPGRPGPRPPRRPPPSPWPARARPWPLPTIAAGRAAGAAAGAERDAGGVLDPAPLERPRVRCRAGGTVFFTANDGIHGRELWKSDGTAAGTVLVKDIRPDG